MPKPYANSYNAIMWFDVNNIIDVKVISIMSTFQVKNTEFLDIKEVFIVDFDA